MAHSYPALSFCPCQ